jgi:hypothetical protein
MLWGSTEVWVYNSGGQNAGTAQACMVNVMMLDSRVIDIDYRGPTGLLLLKDNHHDLVASEAYCSWMKDYAQESTPRGWRGAWRNWDATMRLRLCTAGFALSDMAGAFDDGDALIERAFELNPNLA